MTEVQPEIMPYINRGKFPLRQNYMQAVAKQKRNAPLGRVTGAYELQNFTQQQQPRDRRQAYMRRMQRYAPGGQMNASY